MAYYRNTRTGEKWVKDGLGSPRSNARMAVLFVVLVLLVAIGAAAYDVWFVGRASCDACGPAPTQEAKGKPKPKQKGHQHRPNELFEGTDDAMKKLGKLP